MKNNRLKINIFILLGLVFEVYEFSYGALPSAEIEAIKKNSYYINLGGYTQFNQLYLWTMNSKQNYAGFGKIDLIGIPSLNNPKLTILDDLTAQINKTSVILAFRYDPVGNNLIVTSYDGFGNGLSDIASIVPASSDTTMKEDVLNPPSGLMGYIHYSLNNGPLVSIPSNKDFGYNHLTNIVWVYINSPFNYTPIIKNNLSNILNTTPAAAIQNQVRACLNTSKQEQILASYQQDLQQLESGSVAQKIWSNVKSEFDGAISKAENKVAAQLDNVDALAKKNYTIDLRSQGASNLQQLYLWVEDKNGSNTKIGDIDFLSLGWINSLNSYLQQSSILIEFGCNFSTGKAIINLYDSDNNQFLESFNYTMNLQLGQLPQGYIRYQSNKDATLVTTLPIIDVNTLGNGYYLYISSAVTSSTVNLPAMQRALKLIKAVANK